MTQNELSDQSFDSLLALARSGSEEALTILVNRFSPHVYRSIRRSLIRKMRRATDSDDIAQSVWRSFFANRDKHLAIESPAQLRGFLARMAAHKAIDRGREFQSRQTDENEISLSEEGGENTNAVKRRIPTPSEELIAQEALEALSKSVPEKFAAVIRKRAEGATLAEISEELGVPLRSLHRMLQHIREKQS